MLKFSKGSGENNLEFPITQEQVDNLKPCGLHSPRVGNHHGIELPEQLSTQEGLYESSLEIANVVSKVSRQEFPEEFMRKYYPAEWGEFPDEMPEMLSNFGLSFSDPIGMAHSVHMDLATDFALECLRWVLSKGIMPNQARENCIDFLEMVPETIEKIGNASRRNLEMAFGVKCYYGVPRPEEVLGYNLTRVPEGCPPHASFIAGHSADAVSSSVVVKRFELKRYPDVLKQVRDGTYIWGMQRSLLGVHHGVDNVQLLDRL